MKFPNYGRRSINNNKEIKETVKKKKPFIKKVSKIKKRTN
jgi:hypothetical protein